LVFFIKRKMFKQLIKIIKSHQLVFLFFLTIVSNLVTYLFFSKNINLVCRYLDGPHYLAVAKSFYQGITAVNPALLPEWYFSVHLIGFPFFIRFFLFFLPDCLAMLSTVTLFTALAVILFYLLLKQGRYVKNPLWLSLVFIFFSPRWLLYHSVVGSEAIFLTFVFSSLLFYKKERYFLSILMAACSALTRIFGLLMFPLLLYLFVKDKKWNLILSSFLIPLSLFFHFLYYHFRFGDFFAYFRWNTKQIQALPFASQILLRIGEDKTAVAEFFILICLITVAGIWRLRKQPELFLYSLLLFLPIPLLVQVDFSRFFIPVFPFAWLVAFEKFFDSRIFKFVFPLLVIISYVYVMTAVPTNLFPEEGFQELIGGFL
jgi:hypothetical protein